MKKINVNSDGIEYEINVSEDETNGDISSNMKIADTNENKLYNRSIEGIESLILAHYFAGIDVTNDQYVQGVKTAAEWCFNLSANLE